MGGKNSSTSTRTSETAPLYGAQESGILQMLQGATANFQNGGREFYPGQTYAGPTATELEGRNMALDYARSNTAGDDVSSALALLLNPEMMLNPTNIPGYKEAQDNLVYRANTNLMENQLPQIRASGIASGGLGDNKSQIGQGQAIEGTNQALTGAMANMDMQAYAQGLQAMLGAIPMANMGHDINLANANTVAGVGGMERADEQQAINADRERHDFNENESLYQLAALQSLLGSVGQYGVSTDERAKEERSSGNALTQGLGSLIALGSWLYPGGAPAIAAIGGAGGPKA